MTAGTGLCRPRDFHAVRVACSSAHAGKSEHHPDTLWCSSQAQLLRHSTPALAEALAADMAPPKQLLRQQQPQAAAAAKQIVPAGVGSQGTAGREKRRMDSDAAADEQPGEGSFERRHATCSGLLTTECDSVHRRHDGRHMQMEQCEVLIKNISPCACPLQGTASACARMRLQLRCHSPWRQRCDPQLQPLRR